MKIEFSLLSCVAIKEEFAFERTLWRFAAKKYSQEPDSLTKKMYNIELESSFVS